MSSKQAPYTPPWSQKEARRDQYTISVWPSKALRNEVKAPTDGKEGKPDPKRTCSSCSCRTCSSWLCCCYRFLCCAPSVKHRPLHVLALRAPHVANTIYNLQLAVRARCVLSLFAIPAAQIQSHPWLSTLDCDTGLPVEGTWVQQLRFHATQTPCLRYRASLRLS